MKAIVELLPALIVVALYVWSLAFVYRDAGRRGKSPLLTALLAAFCAWPFSWLMWLVFRPELPARPVETPKWEPVRDASKAFDGEPTQCAKCGAPIPGGESKCARCGWTYLA